MEFEQLYQMRFKPLYSEIVRFAVRATSSGGVSDRHLERFNELRLACILMASVVKSASQPVTEHDESRVLQQQCGYPWPICPYSPKHGASDTFCGFTAGGQAPRKYPADEPIAAGEDKKKFNALSSRSLDALIRTGRISDEVGTSIMNDNVLARGISERLHQVAPIITGSEERLDHEPS